MNINDIRFNGFGLNLLVTKVIVFDEIEIISARGVLSSEFEVYVPYASFI